MPEFHHNSEVEMAKISSVGRSSNLSSVLRVFRNQDFPFPGCLQRSDLLTQTGSAHQKFVFVKVRIFDVLVSIAFKDHNDGHHAPKGKEMCPETRFQQNRSRNKEVIANVYFTQNQRISCRQRSENDFPPSDHSYG